MNGQRPILTITGSDSTGGSGVQGDIRTISELGGHTVSAITSITVQTSLGIQEFYDLPAEIVKGQIDAVMNDFQPQIVKIGMIRREDVLIVIVDALEKYRPQHVIYDPVVSSSRGETLMTDEAIRQIRLRLLPLCTLVVVRPRDAALMRSASCMVYQLDDTAMHGLANLFSSAVAVHLGHGETLEEALRAAKAYVNTRIVRVSDLQGRAPELYNEFLDAVATHLHTNSNVSFYADCLNVSSRYLAQVTRRISGKAPKTIIDEMLIAEVERQLSTTDRTVQEIAYHFGFSSQAHLAKFFRKMKGQSPTDFRRTLSV